LDDRGDTQYEHVWTRTAWNCRDFIIEKSPPGVRLTLYYHLALF
jgi:hypothetical protein